MNFGALTTRSTNVTTRTEQCKNLRIRYFWQKIQRTTSRTLPPFPRAVGLRGAVKQHWSWTWTDTLTTYTTDNVHAFCKLEYCRAGSVKSVAKVVKCKLSLPSRGQIGQGWRGTSYNCEFSCGVWRCGRNVEWWRVYEQCGGEYLDMINTVELCYNDPG